MKKITNTPLPLLFLIFFLFATAPLRAQKFRYSIPGLDSLETFIVAGGSSSILQNGQAEIILSNSLISHWVAFSQQNGGSALQDRIRQTTFSSELFGFYGISNSGKWDIGIHLKYNRTRFDNNARSSMFRVFQSEPGAPEVPDNANAAVFDQSFGGLTYAGIRFRLRPLESAPQLVFNGGYALATVKDPLEQRQLGANRDMADIGFTYFKEITGNVYYFFGASASAFFPSSVVDEFLFNTNANFFLIHRTNNRKLTFYPGLSYGLAFKPSKFDSSPLIKTVDYLFAYGGVQVAPNSRYNVFLTAGFPLIMDLKHPQQEIVRTSYSVLSLGGRFGL